MPGGFSSFQLVFGKQPRLPNILEDKLPALEGKTTSKYLAEHIMALYASRKAFREAMYDEKVRKAPRHNVRAVERVNKQGEEVYYRRDRDKSAWCGPATVLGNLSSVYFLVHQGDVVRVAPCKIVATKEVNEKIYLTDKDAVKVFPDEAKEGKEQENLEVDLPYHEEVQHKGLCLHKEGQQEQEIQGQELQEPQVQELQEP